RNLMAVADPGEAPMGAAEKAPEAKAAAVATTPAGQTTPAALRPVVPQVRAPAVWAATWAVWAAWAAAASMRRSPITVRLAAPRSRASPVQASTRTAATRPVSPKTRTG